MEHKASKVFVAGENRIYYGELPPGMARKGLPRDVARTKLFRLAERGGNTLTNLRFAQEKKDKVE